jgi:hypothetical protein
MKKKTKRIRRVRCCGNCTRYCGPYPTYACQLLYRDVEYDWVCDYHKREPKEIK